MKQPKSHRWKDQGVAQTHIHEHHSVTRKNPTIGDNMGEHKGYYVSEVSQRKANTIWFYLYAESRKQMNKTRNRLRTTLWLWGGGERQEWAKQVREIKRDKLLAIK